MVNNRNSSKALESGLSYLMSSRAVGPSSLVVGSFFWKSSCKALDSTLYLMSSGAVGSPSLVVSSFFRKSSKTLDSALYLMSSIEQWVLPPWW